MGRRHCAGLPRKSAMGLVSGTACAAPDVVSVPASGVVGPDVERDVGLLYVGGFGGITAFDLDRGQRHSWPLPERSVASIALSEDGTRLFGVASPAVLFVLDTQTGRHTTLVRSDGHEWHGCVLDKLTRSLVICQFDSHSIVRVRGLDV
jgi:hypothetical protein